MERQGNLHSPRVDDALEHEVESLVRGAPVEARVDEGRAMEDAGDGEPVPQSLVGERSDAEAGDETSGALSHGELVARSELGSHLRPSIFPATRAAVLACAEEEHASTEVLGQLQALPDGEYGNVQQVWEALGGAREESSGHVEQQREPPSEEQREPPSEERREARNEEARNEVEPSRPVPADEHFGFRFDPWYRLAAFAFGVTPSTASASVQQSGDEPQLVVRFGPWSLRTPITNVVDASITGPYATIKTIGPPHVSLADLGLTFATNRERGVCVRFRDAVPGVAPTSLLRHPAVTVTVDDVDRLAAVLRALRSRPI
jgi:hypothetical protein